MKYTRIESPVGRLLLVGDREGLRILDFQSGPYPLVPRSDWTEDRAPFANAIAQLGAYFDGRLKSFDLRLAPQGTEFQLAVWDALAGISYGTTVSYAELASRIGNPGAVRAVGAANGANPLPIVLPCHRVVGSDGSLTGYGGGLEIKEMLLALEGARLPLEHTN
jgi:methylated-DNA-[protein]-cysteine S-methyltransferase